MTKAFSKYKNILSGIISLFIVFAIVYLVACDSRTGITDPPPPPPPPPPNPYGEGNGKITFYRTEYIEGPVVINVYNKTLTDSLVWSSAPNCDTNIAAYAILRKGDYSVYINGKVFTCVYGIHITEKECIRLNYSGCMGGVIPCVNLNGTWLRTADGPCPNCEGLKIYFENGVGEVIYTPPGCRFPLGDIKWINYDSASCTVKDLARDQYGGSPEYQNASSIFTDRNNFTINGPSGIIPYTRISNSYDKKISTNIHRYIIPVDSTAGLRPDQ